jgi:hypothetical protein
VPESAGKWVQRAQSRLPKLTLAQRDAVEKVVVCRVMGPHSLVAGSCERLRMAPPYEKFVVFHCRALEMHEHLNPASQRLGARQYLLGCCYYWKL